MNFIHLLKIQAENSNQKFLKKKKTNLFNRFTNAHFVCTPKSSFVHLFHFIISSTSKLWTLREFHLRTVKCSTLR